MRSDPLTCRVALLVMLAATHASVVAQEIPADIEGMVTYLGFKATDVRKLLQGEVIEVKGSIAGAVPISKTFWISRRAFPAPSCVSSNATIGRPSPF